MLSTSYVPGTPNWTDLGTPDVDAATAFYKEVFGWEFQSAGPEAGGYGMFTVDGRTVAAVGPLTEAGADSAWTLYFHTDDADATAKAVEQAGGTVRFAPLDVFTKGAMAGFTDPDGHQFAVWQPGETKGLDTVNDTNTLCWTELHTADAQRAKSFYGSVFAWEFVDMAMEGMTYSVIKPAGGDDSSGQGGVMGIPDEAAGSWRPYFEVADCDAAAAAAAAHGGTVVAAPGTLEGVGRMALLADPFGAHFSVITSAPAPQG